MGAVDAPALLIAVSGVAPTSGTTTVDASLRRRTTNSLARAFEHPETVVTDMMSVSSSPEVGVTDRPPSALPADLGEASRAATDDKDGATRLASSTGPRSNAEVPRRDIITSRPRRRVAAAGVLHEPV